MDQAPLAGAQPAAQAAEPRLESLGYEKEKILGYESRNSGGYEKEKSRAHYQKGKNPGDEIVEGLRCEKEQGPGYNITEGGGYGRRPGRDHQDTDGLDDQVPAGPGTLGPPTVALLTLGCKLNLADSEAMARRLRDAGWTVVDRLAAEADAVIVNTCSVTHTADAKSRHLVRMARRTAPGARIALTGCMLETAKPEVIDGLGADLVYRQPMQAELASALIEMHPVAAAAGARPFRTRAFVSAQEGCNDVCAFCIVPRTRGRERSKPVEAVVADVLAREAEGVQEVVITGTQLGAWGREQGRRGLYPVLEALLQETAVPRIRMSSVQPQDLSAALVDLWRDPRLCRHFHLALQSGSEAVLRRMRRRYSAQEYRAAVETLRRAIPGVAITTDVIAGFPGETDDEFEETAAFCREMAFAGMHVFPYSQRSGTAAARMPGQVAEPIKKERVRRLMAIGDEMARSYRQGFVGSPQAVLWETSRVTEGGRVWEGLTDTYVRVFAQSGRDLENVIAPVRIVELCEGGVRGLL